MKKFKFSLQKVLEYNTHIQRREKEILAVMRAEYNELEGQLAQLMSEYELNRMNYLNKCIKGTSINN
ncbi:MAG TPA: flagellar export protein FliJ, partial [Clostridiales bacterium]|nr:flagellar export protein FliJ [Clostridiales bacterium]